MRTLPSALTWLAIAFFVALSGVIYNALFSEGPHSYVGATYALFCGIPLVAFERGLIAPRLHRRIQRLPTPAYVPAALVAEFALISLGFAGAGILFKSLGLIAGSWAEAVILPPQVFV